MILGGGGQPGRHRPAESEMPEGLQERHLEGGPGLGPVRAPQVVGQRVELGADCVHPRTIGI